jgi:magnesium chelatase subunit D
VTVTVPPRSAGEPAEDAALAALLFALDPVGLGGVALRSPPSEARERWIARVRAELPSDAPFRRIPLHVSDERLLGGLDLAATLRSGRPVLRRGVLAEADNGVVVLAMAERLDPSAAGRIALALDRREIALERDGLAARLPARAGVILLDEGATPDEHPPPALLERLAIHLDLHAISARELEAALERIDAQRPRARVASIRVDDSIAAAVCAAASSLGIASLRPPLHVLRVARAAAALGRRAAVSERDVELAVRLVLGPRVREEGAASPPDEPDAGPDAALETGHEAETPTTAHDASLEQLLVRSARASLPPGLLAELRTHETKRRPHRLGKAGARRKSSLRGRPAGIRPGRPGREARLSVVDTLVAAAPWQRLRREARSSGSRAPTLEVRTEDFRIRRYAQRSETTAIFVVDASGSTARLRLAEAKGAIELLLSDCYVRRDRVALLAFRGRGAEVLIAPTRSLVRAKRSLAALPGGGGTPLAAAIEAASQLADVVRRRGSTPLVVLLTDACANVARDGSPGRALAERDALAAALALQASGVGALVIDTSPRPQAAAQRIAARMGARYVPLPHADPRALSDAVRCEQAALRV